MAYTYFGIRSRAARSLLLPCLFLVLPVSVGAGCAHGQGPDPSGSPASAEAGTAVADRPLATRAELEARLETLEARTSGSDGTASVEEQRQAERIRERLRRGDFKVGDLVDLQVRQDQALQGTFPINRDRALELPTLPAVSMEGILYSEVEEHLREALGEYLRAPTVRARALWRVAVVGGVSSPGYYDLSPATTVSEALMRAGGPTQRAKLDEVEFRRGEENLLDSWDEPVESITLAELDARRGDQIYVPQSGGGAGVMRVIGLISGVSGLAWAVVRIF